MNYRHIFHAGNFADVFKHALLARVLTYMVQKPAPLRYIDTHAGLGRYDLSSEEAARTGEWRDGIGRLALAGLPPGSRELFLPYLTAVGPLDAEGKPASYPGSPAVAQTLLRPQDRIALCELHPVDVEMLKQNIGRDRRVKVMALDGYTGLNAFVPPPERRGLVLIDPPFESREEFDRMFAALVGAHRKWSTGTYMLWYPIKDQAAVSRFATSLAGSGIRRILQLHLFVEDRVAAEDGPLAGCGLVVVNPPYTLELEARGMLPLLAELLGRSGAGTWISRTLTGE